MAVLLFVSEQALKGDAGDCQLEPVCASANLHPAAANAFDIAVSLQPNLGGLRIQQTVDFQRAVGVQGLRLHVGLRFQHTFHMDRPGGNTLRSRAGSVHLQLARRQAALRSEGAVDLKLLGDLRVPRRLAGAVHLQGGGMEAPLHLQGPAHLHGLGRKIPFDPQGSVHLDGTGAKASLNLSASVTAKALRDGQIAAHGSRAADLGGFAHQRALHLPGAADGQGSAAPARNRSLSGNVNVCVFTHGQILLSNPLTARSGALPAPDGRIPVPPTDSDAVRRRRGSQAQASVRARQARGG